MPGLLGNIGMGLAEYGKAYPQINQIEEQDQQKRQEAAVARVLQQYAAQRQGGQGQPQQGAPTPGGTPGGAPGAALGGQSTQAMPAGPGGAMGAMPNLEQMTGLLSKSGLPEDQQFEALQKYGAFTSPYEKMVQQMELKQQALTAAQQRVDDQLQNAKFIATMRNNTQERGQDIKADIADKNAQLQYAKMSGVDLRGELNSIGSQLANNPKLSTDERNDLQSQWKAAKQALDDKRKAQGLPPAKDALPATAATPTAKKIATPAANKIPPDAPTATSADGKKVVFDGKTWVPVEGD